MRESFEAMVARVNASAYIPNDNEVFVMAKQVKLPKGREFTFSSGKGGGNGRYPWDEWFKGELLLIEQSEGDKDEKGNVINVTKKLDYEVATDFMPGKLKAAARRRYKVVQISRKDADGAKLGDALIFRARDMTADERVAEDAKRVEEKARRAADDNGSDDDAADAPAA